MSKPREIFTTVDATATAETRNRSVSFTIATRSTGKDAASARAKSDEVLARVITAIKALNAQDAGIDEKGMKCTYDTQPWQEYDRQTNEHVHKGYQVNGSVVCSTDDVDMATVVHDALSKIEGAVAQRPVFVADESYAARDAAFRAAYGRAMEDFRMQCIALGRNPDDFEVVSYSPTREEMHGGGMTRAVAASAMMSDAPMAEAPEIKAGRAEISAYVRLAFAKKSGPATRASSSKSKGGGATRTSDSPAA